MREKTLKLVITFHTTTDAMAMEKACKSQGISGRLIPIPQEISVGCGLAQCAQLDQKEELLAFMGKEDAWKWKRLRNVCFVDRMENLPYNLKKKETYTSYGI
ncbi:MAG: DUF3343 domain-containing protein [Coprococcus sp.]